MLAAAPVDLEDDLSQAMVVIGDDLNDERAKKLLTRSRGHPWRIPGRLEVICEPDKVGYWCGGARRFNRRQRTLQACTRSSVASQLFSSCAAISRLSGSQAA